MSIYTLYNQNDDEEFDIKRVEEQTAELEKDLIVKELETLDVLEELTTTKRVVEELKRQLQKEALKCLTIDQDHQHSHNLPSPHIIKEMNNNNNNNNRNNLATINKHHDMNLPSPNCPTSSPDLILTELKRAKLNLGKTITDLGVIQNSVECLTKKMRKEKEFIEKTRERLTSKFAGVLTLEEELESSAAGSEKPSSKPDSSLTPLGDDAAVSCMKKTAEMRWVAAKKMGEAAKAAEAVALAEINALSSGESPAEFLLSEPDKMSFNFRVQAEPAGWSKKRLALADAMLRIDEAHASKIAIMRKLQEASEEVKLSKQALEEALNRVDAANRKQLAAEEAMSKWMVRPAAELQDRKRYAPIASGVYVSSPRIDAFSPADRRHVDYRHAEFPRGDGGGADGAGAKPVLKTTVSMRDVLSKKQVAASDHQDLDHYGAARRERNNNETHKVALSDMLQALRDDLNFPSKTEKVHHNISGTDMNNHNHNLNHSHNHQKQFWTQRKKFGFIQISLPLTKPSKKKTQSL